MKKIRGSFSSDIFDKFHFDKQCECVNKYKIHYVFRAINIWTNLKRLHLNEKRNDKTREMRREMANTIIFEKSSCSSRSVKQSNIIQCMKEEREEKDNIQKPIVLSRFIAAKRCNHLSSLSPKKDRESEKKRETRRLMLGFHESPVSLSNPILRHNLART